MKIDIRELKVGDVFYKESSWAHTHTSVKCTVSNVHHDTVFYTSDPEEPRYSMRYGSEVDIYTTPGEVWANIIDKLQSLANFANDELEHAKKQAAASI